MSNEITPSHGERKNQRFVREQRTDLCGSTTTACDRYCATCREWIDTQKHDFLDVSMNCPKCKTRW